MRSRQWFLASIVFPFVFLSFWAFRPSGSQETDDTTSGRDLSPGGSTAPSQAAGVASKAAANPFGLPVPASGLDVGALVLHGGGDLSDDVFERFLDLAGGRTARIVFIPSAGYSRSEFDDDLQFVETLAEDYPEWAGLSRSGRVHHFQFLFTDDPADADDRRFIGPILASTGVWFSGGDQDRLNRLFVGTSAQPTRFQTELACVVRRGGVVGGTSAGMAALPEIMTLAEKTTSGARATIVPGRGLGLLQNVLVEQHFDGRGGRLERFTDLLRNNPRLDELTGRPGAGARTMGLAVEERGALVIRGSRLEALGEASVHIFQKSASGRSITWHELPAGSAMEIDPS